jgi:hypothetical protein
MNATQHVAAWVRTAAHEHWLPLALLSVPVLLTLVTQQELWLLLVPLVAFASGFQLRPHHVWLVWLAAITLLWLGVGVWFLVDASAELGDPETGETAASLFAETFPITALLILAPMWFGRLVRAAKDEPPPGKSPGSATT